MLFDYDNISEWGPRLDVDLREHIPRNIADLMIRAAPQYASDAFEELSLRATASKAELAEITSRWIKAQFVAAYHGSRLTQPEIATIQKVGLRPLVARDRLDRLTLALAGHPEWEKVKFALPATLDQFGRDGVKNGNGLREGQVHATISRSGLSSGFNHYLTYGSEFDQKVATELLGESGKELLGTYGQPVIFSLNVPGELAFSAANPYWPHLPRGDLPNIVRETLYAYAFWLAGAKFETSNLEIDCGLIFDQDVPAEWVVAVVPWKDAKDTS